MSWRDFFVSLNLLAPAVQPAKARHEIMARLSASVDRHSDTVTKVTRSAEVRNMMTENSPDREDAKRAERQRVDTIEALLKGMDER